MTASRFADELDAISEKIGDVPRHELAVLLRRAAIRIRSKAIVLDDEVEDALERAGADLGLARPDALRKVIADALIGAGYLAVETLEDDSPVEGSA